MIKSLLRLKISLVIQKMENKERTKFYGWGNKKKQGWRIPTL